MIFELKKLQNQPPSIWLLPIVREHSWRTEQPAFFSVFWSPLFQGNKVCSTCEGVGTVIRASDTAIIGCPACRS